MVHDVQAIREDLAFMRALAQEGRRAPLVNGQSLLVGGAVYGLAGTLAWLVAIRILALPRWWEGAVWPLATVGYVSYVKFWCAARRDRMPGATAITNRAVGAAWRGIGYALLSLLLASWLIAYELKSTMVFAVFPSVVLAIYGAAWVVASAMSEVKWLPAVAVACFLSSVAIGLTADSPAIYLVTAVAVFATMSIPGWLLMRGEPSGVV